MAIKSPIIGIAGPARAGKDTLARALIAAFERTGVVIEQRSFAAPIREFICQIIGTGLKGLEEVKEDPHPLLNGKSPRYAMQTLGTEWGRQLIGENFWCDLALARAISARNDEGIGTVFSDVRFENEAAAVRQSGGVIIHIRRPGAGIQSSHASEVGVAHERNDFRFANSGSLEHLEGWADFFAGLRLRSF
jgi:hypothetical protein